MIHLYAEGVELALPSSVSFQYNVENPFVSEAEGYSMSIEVPLSAGRNMSVFGMLQRLDADISKIRFDAQLISPQYCASGVLAVVGISGSNVKLQFLQGRSAQNFISKTDETYINELSLGKSPLPYVYHKVLAPDTLKSIDEGAQAVALPWVMSGSGKMLHNRMIRNPQTGEIKWAPDTTHISYMPYLIVVAKRICEAAGFSYDFSQWEQSVKRHLVVCNVMPESLQMHDFSYPLPHWTISEFFNALEDILGGQFTIDNIARNISYSRSEVTLEKAGVVELRQVVDDFSVTLEVEPEKEQRPEFLRNRGYEDNSGRFWPVRCCDWYIRQRLSERQDPEESSSSLSVSRRGGGGSGTVAPNPGWAYDTMYDSTQAFRDIKRFDTMDELIEYAIAFRYNKNRPGFGGEALFYSADCRSFFCLHAVQLVDISEIPQEYKSKYNISEPGKYHDNWLCPVNDFGDYILDNSDDADRVDLKAVPVDVDVSEALTCFLPFSESSDTEYSDDESARQPRSFSLMMEGKKERPQYYDKLYLGYWTGVRKDHVESGLYPLTSNVSIFKGWKYEFAPEGCDLRLNNGFAYGSPAFRGVDFHKVYKISFIAGSIPDVSAVFLIRGKRYICKKITADFTASGMSRLLKGEFYRLE